MTSTTPLGGAPDAPRPFLEIRDVHKHFAGVRALRGVSLAIQPGQIHHLLGENGCGKSTLIKIVSGALVPDAGTLVIDGREVRRLSALGALSAGIQTVYQDLSLLPNLSVAENIALTQQLVGTGGRLVRRLDLKRLADTSAGALAAVGLPTDGDFLETLVDELPIATRQLVAIARAVATDAKLVIMDEPTTALTKHEVENLIGILDKLRGRGVAVLFVTHKLDECKRIGGRAIVMRDGQKVTEGDIAGYSKRDLGLWMTGKSLDENRYRTVAPGMAPLLEVRGLERGALLRGVSFSLARGEILGVTGLLDSGRNELAHALAGVSPAERGELRVEGQVVRFRQPSDAIAAGVGYVPEDRLSEGLFLEKPIRDNLVAEVLDRLRRGLGFLDRRRSEALAARTAEDLHIVTPDLANPVQSLSGGNQQRVLIGRSLTIAPRVLVLHGPTVGVDVGSKDTIFRIIQKLAVGGMGVIIISDDLPELLQNCDRILVMRRGTVAEMFDAQSLGEETLYEALLAESAPGNRA